MFIQVNPDASSYSESLSTLKFAERVSTIELGAARSNKEGKEVRDLMDLVSAFPLCFNLMIILLHVHNFSLLVDSYLPVVTLIDRIIWQYLFILLILLFPQLSESFINLAPVL